VTSDRHALAAAGLTAALWGLTGIFVRLLPPLAPEVITAGRLVAALLPGGLAWLLRKPGL
jgi:hypothetical protein